MLTLKINFETRLPSNLRQDHQQTCAFNYTWSLPLVAIYLLFIIIIGPDTHL